MQLAVERVLNTVELLGIILGNVCGTQEYADPDVWKVRLVNKLWSQEALKAIFRVCGVDKLVILHTLETKSPNNYGQLVKEAHFEFNTFCARGLSRKLKEIKLDNIERLNIEYGEDPDPDHVRRVVKVFDNCRMLQDITIRAALDPLGLFLQLLITEPKPNLKFDITVVESVRECSDAALEYALDLLSPDSNGINMVRKFSCLFNELNSWEEQNEQDELGLVFEVLLNHPFILPYFTELQIFAPSEGQLLFMSEHLALMAPFAPNLKRLSITVAKSADEDSYPVAKMLLRFIKSSKNLEHLSVNIENDPSTYKIDDKWIEEMVPATPFLKRLGLETISREPTFTVQSFINLKRCKRLQGFRLQNSLFGRSESNLETVEARSMYLPKYEELQRLQDEYIQQSRLTADGMGLKLRIDFSQLIDDGCDEVFFPSLEGFSVDVETDVDFDNVVKPLSLHHMPMLQNVVLNRAYIPVTTN